MVQAARAGDDEMSRIALEEVGREEGKVALIRHQGAAEPGRSLPERAAIGPHLFRKLAVFAPLESQEMARFQGLASSEGQVPADHHLVRAGEEYGPVIVVNSGWAVRYRMLADGSRQIANFILPGDFIGLNATVMSVADYDVVSITPMTFVRLRVDDIIGMIESHPRLCAAIFWCNAREESILFEHLTSLGRRTAYERVAHLLIELLRRLQLIELTDGDSFVMPLTQQLIADSVGLTAIHVNRMMRALEQDGLIAYSRHPVPRLHVRDVRRLEAAAGFEEGYLHFTEMPRRTRRALAGVQTG